MPILWLWIYSRLTLVLDQQQGQQDTTGHLKEHTYTQRTLLVKLHWFYILSLVMGHSKRSCMRQKDWPNSCFVVGDFCMKITLHTGSMKYTHPRKYFRVYVYLFHRHCSPQDWYHLPRHSPATAASASTFRTSFSISGLLQISSQVPLNPFFRASSASSFWFGTTNPMT